MNYLFDADYTELRVFNRETREIHEKSRMVIVDGKLVIVCKLNAQIYVFSENFKFGYSQNGFRVKKVSKRIISRL